MPCLSVKSALRAAALLAASLAALCLSPPAPAAAQSLFDALFGTPKPPSPPPGYGPPVRLLPPGQGLAPGHPLRLPLSPYPSIRPPRADDGEGPRPNKSARLRTVCVRMCDGYYWPVSFATTRERLSRDADVCRASCGEEARLFYMPSTGAEIEEAVDLTGLTYARLPNAFRYRKRLVDGCACRPAPWSDAERSRHESYAAAAAGTGASAAQAIADKTVKVFNAAGDEVHGPPVPPDLDEMTAMAAPLPPRRTRSVVPPPLAREPLVQRTSARPMPQERRRAPAAAVAPLSGGSWSASGGSKLIWPGDRPN